MSIEILNTIAQSQEAQQELAEAFVADVMSQLDVVDPAEDAEELIKLFASCISEGQAGEQLLTYILGVSPDEWLEDLVVD